MPIFFSSNSAANKDKISKILTMGIQFSDWVEDNVGKGEIARYKQFFSHNVIKSCSLCVKMSIYEVKG